jgi:hypothetical protein
VVSLLGVLPLVLNTGMGGVVALSWRGGMLIFEFQVGDLKNIWLIDSDCSRHMTGDKGWFSGLAWW